MSTVLYKVGANYPNISGVAEWEGSVKTDTITGSILSNGKNTGQFTGSIIITDSVSENATLSTLSWTFDVLTADTIAKGSFKLCLSLIHDNGDKEVIDLNTVATVDECA